MIDTSVLQAADEALPAWPPQDTDLLELLENAQTADAEQAPHALGALLKDVWGFPGFRGPQLDIILRCLHGDSQLAVLPTGGSCQAAVKLVHLLARAES